MVEIFLRYISERIWECIWGFLGGVLSIVGIVDVLWVFRLIVGELWVLWGSIVKSGGSIVLSGGSIVFEFFKSTYKKTNLDLLRWWFGNFVGITFFFVGITWNFYCW